MLLSRLISALLLVPIVVLCLVLGGLPFLALILLATAVAVYEFYSMFYRAGHRPFRLLGVAAAVAIVVATYMSDMLSLPGDGVSQLPTLMLTATILLTLIATLIVRRPLTELAADWMITLAGVMYVGWLIRYALLLRLLPLGWQWTIFAVVSTWAADTGGYVAGRAFGRRKVCPQISPGKTWAGIVGSFILTIGSTAIGGPLLLGLDQPLSVALGLMLTVAAITGDLAESLLKRAAGVKDSGAIIPGHGGLLDRIDSLLFVLPLVYYFSVLIS